MSITLSFLFTVISELTITEGRMEEFLTLVNSELHASRQYAGNLGFDIYAENESANKVFFVEKWSTE